jgi:3',5'-cyclic AMP phosphodiesterase CpdA
VGELRRPGELTLAILADTHFAIGGTWDDLLAGLELLNGEIGLDGIIHLGDLTDGMVAAEVTRHYVKNMLAGLKSLGLPVWVALGNHDSNYFRNNPERFSEEAQREIYLDGRETRYYVDLSRLRLIFLDSFEPDKELRYGYSLDCARWLEQALEGLPEGGAALIFSHLPPLTRLQYWAKALRGEKEISEVTSRYASRILAWFNGHNHADRLDNDEGFPIVSIANAKCEAFTEYKTEGFVTPARRLGEASQELWDVLIVKERTVRLVRFGAGRDRVISNGKARWG